MEPTENLETGFFIEKLLLVESSFRRVSNVVFDEEVENIFGVDVEVNVDGSTIVVAESAGFKQKFKEEVQVEAKIRMIGVFKVAGDPEISNYEKFGRINGAAIIFPYIREHLTMCCLKAGLGSIFLPPVNFTKDQ